MTKSPLGGGDSGKSPVDRGKMGVKRSLCTDAKGIPLSIVIAGANRHDVKLLQETLTNLQITRPKPAFLRAQHLCLDPGYVSPATIKLAATMNFILHLRSRGEEAKKVLRIGKRKARRWVVERSHSWLNRFRRILIRWEKISDRYLSMLYLACAIITWRQVGLLR